ncbi:hypothetical protein B0T25DRAFT_546397 [Lasiosphaeria hispida]|uniref:Uncharacterized protein n=1 Tax=Lasiosphaeria hispida TaxID=260671 RepID=A0AAJ0MBN6_9PEZI|nr:hypothetical protein B0T25DRAFT_546397 [Lasiosphaeria hispida]
MYRLLWLTGFTAVSLIANFISLLGGVSPAIKDFALYRVNVTQLADELQKQAHSGKRDTAELRNPNLPTWWYWGMSGICDIGRGEEPGRCHREFPPTKGILAIVEDSLRDGDQGLLPANSSSTLSAWNATLSSLPPSVFADKEASFVTQSKASAGLVILAVITDFASPFLAWIFGAARSRSYIAPTVSSLLAIAAGTLATLSMHNGPHGASGTGEHGGLGIIALFIGAAVRLVTTLIAAASTPSGKGPTHTPPRANEELSNREIGYLGESLMHNWFESEKMPGWSYENWTSGLRSEHGEYPPFGRNEKDYTDFTYVDGDGAMVRFLRKGGAKILKKGWSQNTMFHLEVKTTPGGLGTPLYVSQYQLEKMQAYDGRPDHAYILVRVFNIRQRRPGIKFYTNPGSHRGVRFGDQNKYGSYPVWCSSSWNKTG